MARDDSWLKEVQDETHEWRMETLDGDPTVLTQAAHTSVEANELLDLPLKGETYQDGSGPASGWHDDDARREFMEELGDVFVAALGVASLAGLDARDCIGAALEKNGARDWAEWQDPATAGDD